MRKAVCVFTNNSVNVDGYVLFTEQENRTKIEVNLKGNK